MVSLQASASIYTKADMIALRCGTAKGNYLNKNGLQLAKNKQKENQSFFFCSIPSYRIKVQDIILTSLTDKII